MSDELSRRVDALEAQLRELRSGEKGSYWSNAAPQTYTVAWTSIGTAPVIGNGNLTGRCIKIGKLVWVSIRMMTGSTTTYGTSDYRWSLPFTAATPLYAVGSAFVVDQGTRYYTGTAILANATNALIITETGYVLGATNPFTMATSDEVRMDMVYQEA